MMTSRIKRHIPFIRQLNNKSEKKTRDKYIKRASQEEIYTICECALNICKGNVPLSNKQLTKLKKYQRNLHHLAFGKSNLQTKKRYIIQKGGGLLPIIVASVLPLLAKIFSRE